MTEKDTDPLSDAELAAEAGTALPPKEVISLLDLNADLDLALDLAAPIDLAVAANANVAAPINAAVGANILSAGSTAQALADQGVHIDQGISGEAVATAPQDSTIDQGDDVVDDPTDTGGTTPADGTTAPAADGTTAPAADAGSRPGRGHRPTRPRCWTATCSTSTSTPRWTPTSPRRSPVRWRPTPTSPRRSTPPSRRTSAPSAPSATAVADQDAIISQHLDDVTAEATHRPDVRHHPVVDVPADAAPATGQYATPT